MILQVFDIFRILAEIIGAILNFLKPIVSPIGAWMINWIEAVLKVFPENDLLFYIIIFVILIGVGLTVNILWPGDKPPRLFEKKYKLIELEKESERETKTEASKAIFKKEYKNDFVEPEENFTESEDYSGI